MSTNDDKVVAAPFARKEPGPGNLGQAPQPTEPADKSGNPQPARQQQAKPGQPQSAQTQPKEAQPQPKPRPVKPVPPQKVENGRPDIPESPTPDGRSRRRVPWGIISYILAVLLPVAAVASYYAFVAADQYKVETRFAVRSTTPSLGSGLLTSLGIGGGASVSDTYMVVEYIHSRELLAKIDSQLNLKERFRRARQDFYAALPAGYSMEDFIDYWRSMVQVHLDHTSNIVTVSVFAFTAEDARDISRAILRESEQMINRISEQARRDAVWYAEQEVKKAEERLKEIRQRFLRFRDTTQQLDPTKQAQVQVSLIGKLEEELVKLKAKLAESRTYLSKNAPTVQFLRNRIQAVQKQIETEKRKLGGGRITRRSNGNNSNLSSTLSEYEALLVEREFAEKLYLSTLTGLEQARLLANRQQRYLATFVSPYVPEEALYPKSVRNTFFVFISLTLIWALGMLMLQSVRDRI